MLEGRKVNGKVQILPLDTVQANPWNPNEMTDETFASLKHGFETEGWLINQSLLVWNTDETGRPRKLIIDGEHRWTVAQELGMTTGPMVLLDGITEAKARAMTVAFNHRRGTSNDEKLAALLKSIEPDLPSLDLEVGVSKDEMDRLMSLSVEPIPPAPVPNFPSSLLPPPPAPPPPVDLTPKVDGKWKILRADLKLLEVLQDIPDNTFDAMLSDPPYGLSPDGKSRTWDDIDEGRAGGGFMGEEWDAAVPGPTFWKEICRVLKPGAPIVAFGGSRTYHRLAAAMEDSGLEIRDCISWLYSVGMPKRFDISKALDEHFGTTDQREVVGSKKGVKAVDGRGHGAAVPNAEKVGVTLDVTLGAHPMAKLWDGYDAALKPMWEPGVLARKPLSGTYAENILQWGVGGLWIDPLRLPVTDEERAKLAGAGGWAKTGYVAPVGATDARAAAGGFAMGVDGKMQDAGYHEGGRWPGNVIIDEAVARMLDAVGPGLSRFFYCAKPSRREREAGLEFAGIVEQHVQTLSGKFADGNYEKDARNIHPTVKPISLMRYLATMILPPPGPKPRKLLIPFSGSGSEMIGAIFAGWDDVLGLEREEKYIEIAKARVAYAVSHPEEYSVQLEEEVEEAAQ